MRQKKVAAYANRLVWAVFCIIPWVALAGLWRLLGDRALPAHEVWRSPVVWALAFSAGLDIAASFLVPPLLVRRRVQRAHHSLGSWNPVAVDDQSVAALCTAAWLSGLILAAFPAWAGAVAGFLVQSWEVAVPFVAVSFLLSVTRFPRIYRWREWLNRASGLAP